MGSIQRTMSAGFFSFSSGGGDISSVVPNCGYVTGGYNVVLVSNSSAFGGSVGVITLGNRQLEVISWSPMSVTIIMPEYITGQFDIIVTLPNSSVITALNGFTYLSVPTVQNSKIKINNPPSEIKTTLTSSAKEIIKKFSFDIENPMRRMWLKQQGSQRLVSLGQIQTINEFIRVMWQALQLHRPSVVFEPAYPSYVLDSEDKDHGDPRPIGLTPTMPEEVITWNVVRRTPGSVDHTAFARTREIRPRIREELVYDPIILGENGEPELQHGIGQFGPDQELSRVVGHEIEGQWFDNLIQFDIWSKDNKKAEQLCDYLENFMHDFHGMFIELGVNKMHFHSRVRDEFLLKWRNGLCNRSLLFFVRTETVRAGAVREIRKIHVNAEVRTYLDEIGKLGSGAFIESSRNMIIDKWVSSQPD